MKKRFMMFTLLAAVFSGVAHADDAAILSVSRWLSWAFRVRKFRPRQWQG